MMNRMTQGTLYPAIAKLYGDRLAEQLQRWQNEGLSQYDVRDRIEADHGIRVSQSTVSRWYRDFVVKQAS